VTPGAELRQLQIDKTVSIADVLAVVLSPGSSAMLCSSCMHAPS
jgi:hypothetical protein